MWRRTRDFMISCEQEGFEYSAYGSPASLNWRGSASSARAKAILDLA
jgi:hypothetical protein